MRNLALFAALFFTGLVAGTAFVIWVEYNPSGMTGSFYAGAMQHAILVFTTPLPIIVALSVVFTALSAFLGRRERSVFVLLLVASVCTLAVALITAFGNIPLNNQIKTWDVSSPPQNWPELATRWWQFQTARATAAIVGFSCLILTAIRSRH